MKLRVPAVALFAAAALVLSAQPVQAQEHLREVGIGYVANAASQMLGGGVHFVVPALNGVGLYLDGKTAASTPSSEANFRSDITADEVEAAYPDRATRNENRWTTVNLALVRPLTPELTIYGGAGYSWRTAYVEFEDFSLTRGERGLYWVEDPPASGDAANFLVGGFFRIAPRFVAQFGFETAPRGMSVGGRYVFSF